MYFYMIKMIKNGDNGKKGDMAWLVINNMIKKIKNDDNDQIIKVIYKIMPKI